MNQNFKLRKKFTATTISKRELQILYPHRNIHHWWRNDLSWKWEWNSYFQELYLCQVFKAIRMFTVFQTVISCIRLQLKDLLLIMDWQNYCWCTYGISLFNLKIHVYRFLVDAENYFLVNFFFKSALQHSLKEKEKKIKRKLS